MTVEEFTSEAYLKGQEDAKDLHRIGGDAMDFPNPYTRGTREWELWNLGWNHQIMHDNP